VIVIMPVVTFYLICDWHRMIDTLNSWVPPHSRDTVDQLVREIDAAVSGFLRGQADICLIVALYFAIALSLAGLNFSVLIGVLTFIPYVGSIIGILIGVGVAIEQFWPQWVPVAIVVGIFLVGQFVAAYVLGPRLVGNKVGPAPGLAHLRNVRVRISVWVRWPVDRGPARRRNRRAVSLCAQALLRKSILRGSGSDLIAAAADRISQSLKLQHLPPFQK
jgi:hypothetical protein